MEARDTDLPGVIRAAVITVGFLACLIPVLPLPAWASSEVEMSGFTIVQETVGGRWEIEAQRASYLDEREVILNGVSARMISGGQDRVSVVSDRGRYESGQQVLHLEGNVVVASRWGSSLRAPAVLWNGSGAYLEASGGVRLQRGAILVNGGSARYMIDTSTAWIIGEVRTVLEVRKKGP